LKPAEVGELKTDPPAAALGLAEPVAPPVGVAAAPAAPAAEVVVTPAPDPASAVVVVAPAAAEAAAAVVGVGAAAEPRYAGTLAPHDAMSRLSAAAPSAAAPRCPPRFVTSGPPDAYRSLMVTLSVP
jgi:hypothetical protein